MDILDVSYFWLPLIDSGRMLVTLSYIIDHYILNQHILVVLLKSRGKSCTSKFLLFVLLSQDYLFLSAPPSSDPADKKRTLPSLFLWGKEMFFVLFFASLASIGYFWDFSYKDLLIIVQRIQVPVEREHEIKNSREFSFPFLCEGLGWNINWNWKRLFGISHYTLPFQPLFPHQHSLHFLQSKLLSLT